MSWQAAVLKFAVSATRSSTLLHVCLPLPGGPRPESEWDVNGTPWTLFETQGREALPKHIQLKFYAFYALCPLYIIRSLKQHAP